MEKVRTKQQTIRALNDNLRLTWQGGKIVMSRAIACLPAKDQATIMQAVRSFRTFSKANDPYGEHDCAIFEAAGQRCMWKIDYYDAAMEFGSEDPADPSKTTRVLTIMLASDY